MFQSNNGECSVQDGGPEAKRRRLRGSGEEGKRETDFRNLFFTKGDNQLKETNNEDDTVGIAFEIFGQVRRQSPVDGLPQEFKRGKKSLSFRKK